MTEHAPKQPIISKKILVVGDWIVDENWIVTKEDSQTSSHIGKQLYRSKITNINAQLLSLCGAGGVARFLHGSRNDIQIYGFGLWNPNDTKLLAALFRSDCSILNQTPLTLKGMYRISRSAKSNPLCHSDRNCITDCKNGEHDCERLHTVDLPDLSVFRQEEFGNDSDISSLCQYVKDNYDLGPMSSQPNTIVWLNELLGKKNFELQVEKRDPDFRNTLSEDTKIRLEDFKSATKTSRPREAAKNLRILNRALLEATYQKTPKIQEIGTTRVLRVYGLSGSHSTTLLNRYDWQNHMKTPDTARIKIAISKMLSHIKNGPDAIVIVDHDKGGVTKDLISILLDECTKKYGDNIKKCRWYVRTKNYEADWLNVVKENANVNLKLILAGPMLLNLDKDPWFLGSHLSTGALKWLYNQANIEIENNKPRDPQKVDKMNQPIVVAFHEDNSMAAIVPSHNLDASIKDKDNEHTPSAAQETAVFIAKRYPKAPNYKVGRTSVLFSSLVAAMEVSTTSGTNDVRLKINEEDFEKALKQSYTWCKTIEKEFNKEIFSEDINTNLRSHYSNAIKNDESMKWQGDFEIKRRTLKHELKCWAEAFDPDKLGIVNQSTVTESLSKQHPQGKIQLWRGWSPVKGYISLVEENRRLIAKLLAGIKDFKEDKHHQRPLSSLVIGGPGSGKSYLVSKLAEQLDIEYREFNITQLASIDDLMACFDTISSIQTQKPDKSLMVFWDEINAPLGTHAVYSYFLGPIWNGVYRRGGQTFQLKPCIWIFAGTREIEADNKSRGDADFSKGSDFMSRINGPIINLINYEKTINSQQYKQLQVTAQEKGLQQIEQMYMAVSIVKRHFPHVFYISKESLKCFRDIELKYGIRSLEFLILKMKDIKNGKLNKHNFPKFEEISVWIENPDAFDAIMKGKIEPQEIDDDNYVRIYNEP